MLTRRQLLGASLAGAAFGLGGPGAALGGDYYLTSEPKLHEATPAPPVAEAAIEHDDVREVLARPWKYEEVAITFTGVIVELRVAPPGEGYPCGEDGSLYRSQLLMTAQYADGESERLLIAFDADPVGIHKDNRIDVVAVFGGMHREPAEGGGYWEWPLFIASAIALAPEDAG